MSDYGEQKLKASGALLDLGYLTALDPREAFDDADESLETDTTDWLEMHGIRPQIKAPPILADCNLPLSDEDCPF